MKKLTEEEKSQLQAKIQKQNRQAVRDTIRKTKHRIRVYREDYWGGFWDYLQCSLGTRTANEWSTSKDSNSSQCFLCLKNLSVWKKGEVSAKKAVMARLFAKWAFILCNRLNSQTAPLLAGFCFAKGTFYTIRLPGLTSREATLPGMQEQKPTHCTPRHWTMMLSWRRKLYK
jgi:hypothetical protein